MAASNFQNDSALRVGAAECDITPPLGTHLSGDATRHRPAEHIIDPLHVRALVVEGADAAGKHARLCFLSLELLSIEADRTARIRSEIESRFAIPGGAVIVHTTQNHSAPGLGHYMIRPDSPYIPAEAWWVFGCERAYEDFLFPRIIEAVRLAVSRLEPVEMAIGGMADGRIGFNRRYVMRNGAVQTLPQVKDLADILRPEGPSDPEVGIACFRNQKGEVTAALLHHTAHPCSHFGTNGVSASWPGVWCRRFREIAGPQAVPIMINGCCGNVNVTNALDPERRCDDERIAEMLMQTSVKIAAKLVYAAPTVVETVQRRFVIPYGGVPTDMVKAARRRISQSKGPEWLDAAHARLDVEWLFASAIVDLAEKMAGAAGYPYELQAFRIGDLAIAGLIGEPFVEGQLEIKKKSPAARTFVAHMCNGYVGYIPTEASYHAFNYNYLLPDGRPVRRGANLFQLIPEALNIIVRETRSMIHQLFPDDPPPEKP